MKKILSIVSVFSLTLFVAELRAQLISFGDPTYSNCTIDVGSIDCNPVYNDAVDAVLTEFQTQINAQAGVGDLSIDQYFGGVANSVAIAGSGLGASYGNDFEIFTAGGGFGLGGTLADGQGIGDVISAVSSGDSIRGVIVGGAAQTAVTVGLNAGLVLDGPILWGLVDPDQLRGYLSFMSLSREFTGLGSASMTTFSAMGQYTILPGQGWALNSVKWNGVVIGSGLRYGAMTLTGSFTQNVGADGEYASTISVGGGNDVTVTPSAPLDVSLNVESSTFTIPFEASTSIRLGYVISLYAGMGFDIAFGSTSGGVTAADDTVTVSHTGASGVTFSGDTTVPYTVDTGFANGSGSPSIANLRGFAGAQLELAVMNITLGLQKSLLAGRYAANLGLNFYW